MPDERQFIAELGRVADKDGLFRAVAKLNFAIPSARVAAAIARAASRLGDDGDVRIALLGNSTLDLLPPRIAASFAELGMTADVYVGPFDQYYQEVMTESSGLRRFQPQIVLLALSPAQICPDLHRRYAELTESEREEAAGQLLEHVGNWIDSAAERLEASLLVTNFVVPPTPQLGYADNATAETEREFYQGLNRRLRTILRKYDQAQLLDLDALIARIGWERGHDVKMYYMARIAWSDDLAARVARELAGAVLALAGRGKKCLAVDLDNTLWGGVLGEEGVDGIKVGAGDPVGEAFADVQYRIRALKNRGVVLAICSKNNRDDVEEVFAGRGEMPLRLEDFAAIRINWEPKHANIEAIATELNIGLDSIVFIDDNPVEIDLVQEMLPAVTSILVPRAAERIPGMIASLPLFEKVSVVEEDRAKTQLYRQNRQRRMHRESAGDLQQFLRSLDTRVNLRAAGEADLQRIHQLFNKTNQFNLTTIRYSLAEIRQMLADTARDLWCFSVTDRFGELGLVGLLVIRRIDERAEIDSFVMSCRVMGRGIETSVLNWVKTHYLGAGRFTALGARFVPTGKNAPVENLYIEQEFRISDESGEGRGYEFTVEQMPVDECDWVKLEATIEQ